MLEWVPKPQQQQHPQRYGVLCQRAPELAELAQALEPADLLVDACMCLLQRTRDAVRRSAVFVSSPNPTLLHIAHAYPYTGRHPDQAEAWRRRACAQVGHGADECAPRA